MHHADSQTNSSHNQKKRSQWLYRVKEGTKPVSKADFHGCGMWIGVLIDQHNGLWLTVYLNLLQGQDNISYRMILAEGKGSKNEIHHVITDKTHHCCLYLDLAKK